MDLLQPGWRDRVLARRFLPEMVVVHDIPKAARLGCRGRPGPQVPGMKGLFVVGDWVGSEGMASAETPHRSLVRAREGRNCSKKEVPAIKGMCSSAARTSATRMSCRLC